MQINYSDLSQEAKQEFCDFIWKELNRHAEDIDQIRKDLQVMRDKYGIIPREIYVGNYIEVNLIERTALKIGCAVGTGAHPKKIKYKVRIFDYEAGAWSVDSSHHNLLPAQCNRDNKRKRGLFAIVTFKDEVIK